MYSFRNLDRVGFGGTPYAVGAFGPQIVGAPFGPQIVGQQAMVPFHPSPMQQLRYAPRPAVMPYGPTHPGVIQMPHPAAYSGQPALVSHAPTQVREFIIGFGPTVVNANSTAVFQAQPQLIFRGSRLIIPSTIANNFSVNDIRVGKDSQAVSSNPIPAAAFSELGVGVALGLDTATPGILITLSVANTTGGNQTFSAALIGTSMQ